MTCSISSLLVGLAQQKHLDFVRQSTCNQHTPIPQVAGITEESALYDKHQAAAAAALAGFKSSAMGEPELVTEFEERLAKGVVHQQLSKQVLVQYIPDRITHWACTLLLCSGVGKAFAACALPCQ
jgi:hypothetical protein